MRRSRRRLRVAMFLGLGAILSGLWVVAYVTEAFRDLELDTVDTRFEIRGERSRPRT